VEFAVDGGEDTVDLAPGLLGRQTGDLDLEEAEGHLAIGLDLGRLAILGQLPGQHHVQGVAGPDLVPRHPVDGDEALVLLDHWR